jgi:uncharacterized protein YjiS (DUF1127 family)
MKQSSYTIYHPYSGEIALSASIHAFFSSAIMIPRTWDQRLKQRNALSRLSSRLLDDAGITEAQRLAEVNKPFWRA